MNRALQACRYGVLALLCLVTAWRADAQILQGDWVDASQAAIEKHRKTDVTVIVLDAQDRAVQSASVRLKLDRHDFVLGLAVSNDRMPPKECRTLPVYRCFNAIALDRYTDWANTEQVDLQEQADRLSAWQTALKPRRTHFGRVVSADPARNHDRLSLLSPTDLRDAVLARIDLASVFEPKPDDYDLYADILKQDMLERKLGQGMLPRMFNHAHAARPKASFGVRVRDVISLQNGRALASTIQKLEVRQIPFDHITIEQPFNGPAQPNALQRMLEEYVAPMPVPVTLSALEFGGPTPIASAIKLETVLRLVFAQPRITGIYFAGLLDDELLEENAGLLDKQDNPSAAGEVLDALFTKVWTSDETGPTDERGNMQSRVFTGWYTITATLPDGTVIKSEAYVPASDRAKLIVLQATAAEKK